MRDIQGNFLLHHDEILCAQALLGSICHHDVLVAGKRCRMLHARYADSKTSSTVKAN